MRLFVAINFNNDTLSRLLALRDKLRGSSQHGNFSVPENLHLTLAFLGECDGKQTSATKSILDKVSFEPFDAAIDCVGRFKRDSGDIWWAGMHENNSLSELQHDLTERLSAAGFTLDRRKFSPHITLGREVVTDAMPWAVEPFGEKISAVDLMKSERLAGKLTYTPIYRRAAN